MIQIRKNVFETNSSSTHSLVMAVKSEHAPEAFKGKFKQGNFYSVTEVDAYYEALGEDRDPYDFQTYDDFCDSDYLEFENYSYTTPSGETVVAIAKFGYDG